MLRMPAAAAVAAGDGECGALLSLPLGVGRAAAGGRRASLKSAPSGSPSTLLPAGTPLLWSRSPGALHPGRAPALPVPWAFLPAHPCSSLVP